MFLEISQNSQENTCAFFNKVAGLAQVLSCEFCETFKNAFFTEHFRTTASECTSEVCCRTCSVMFTHCSIVWALPWDNYAIKMPWSRPFRFSFSQPKLIPSPFPADEFHELKQNETPLSSAFSTLLSRIWYSVFFPNRT